MLLWKLASPYDLMIAEIRVGASEISSSALIILEKFLCIHQIMISEMTEKDEPQMC